MRYARILALSFATLLGTSSLAVGQYWAGADRDGDVNSDRMRNSPAYRQGKQQGESDALHNRRPNWRTTRWNDQRSRSDFEMGYKFGYRESSYSAYYGSDQTPGRDQPDGRNDYRGDNQRGDGYPDRGNGNAGGSGYNDRGNGNSDSRNAPNNSVSGGLTIQPNNMITWQTNAPNARVYVMKDNKPEQVFAEGRTGSQGAPWIEQGHQFVFILRDTNGNELARQQLDLRSPATNNSNQRGNR